MNQQQLNAQEYGSRYRTHQYAPSYPDTQVIRVHRYVLEWELEIRSGKVFDFGCGRGNNPRYFADQGYTVGGCDTSEAAVDNCKALLPEHAERFFVVPAEQPNLLAREAPGATDIFLSNQVLYYLDDASIKALVREAYEMVRPGGAFVASMMAYSCWYTQHITEERGDFKKVELSCPRYDMTTYINFKHREELAGLFQPFRKLHIGTYNLGHFREEEGPTDHWMFVGVRD